MSQKIIDDLKHQIALRDAMVLRRYTLVPVLDKKSALAVSTERSKMDQPIARGWAVTAGGVVAGYFTAARDFLVDARGNALKATSWHATQLEALGAYRNMTAEQYAARLIRLDQDIAAEHARVEAELASQGAIVTEAVVAVDEKPVVPVQKTATQTTADRIEAMAAAKNGGSNIADI